MRKAYRKPSLYAEHFAVSEHIASCVMVAPFQAGACGQFYDPAAGIALFVREGDCPDGYEYWDITGVAEADRGYGTATSLGLECYNSFHDGANFFTS